MKLKPEVKDEGVSREIWYALGVADATRPIVPLVVTALTDGKHKEGSKHYVGQGVDLRTKDLPETTLKSWLGKLQARLEPCGFDVIFEGDHIHIEFDPKQGESFYQRLQ